MNARDLEKPPLEANRLYRWMLGDRLVEWADRTEPMVLDSVEESILQCRNAIAKRTRQLADLAMAEGELDLIPSDDYKAEEMRLTILREKDVNMLATLVKTKSVLTAGGVAVLMAGMIRQSAAAAMTARPPERDATPRRTLRRDSTAVVDAENDCS